MDLKQEPLDVGIVKTEPDVSGQSEENNWCSTKQESFKNDYYNNMLGYGDTDNECRASEYLVNVSEIKLEIVECAGPKIEYGLSDLPAKIESDSTQFVSKTIKKELDVPDIVDIGEIKQEVSDSEHLQVKTERELSTTYIDLPTLKSETTDYSDNFVQSRSSKYAGKRLKTLKTTTNVIYKKKKKLYPCLVCQKNFPSSKSKSKHISRHFRKTICEFCGKLMTKIEVVRHYFIHVVKNRSRKVSLKTNNVSNIQPNLIVHTNEEPFKCEICFKRFKRKCDLDIHFIMHTNEKPFKCDICSEEFKHKSSLRLHLKEIHTNEKPFKCNICSKGFNRSSSIKRHLIIHTNEKPFKCDICSKEFKHKDSLQQHLKVIHTNEKPFKCDICSKGFKKRNGMKQHLIIHTDEKPFKCNICSKGFKKQNGMKQHLIIHTDEKPFKCNICSKGFKRKDDLNNHFIIHTNEKPFKCEICSKRFKRKCDLDIHFIMHTNEKPYKCDICSKEFKHKSSLQQHLKVIHTNQKPFKCDICSKEFKRRSGMKLHLIIHTDEKPFTCDICSKRFKRNSDLCSHLKIHTDKKSDLQKNLITDSDLQQI